jgi:hypothetical protein
VRALERVGIHLALLHHDQDAFESEREAARRHILAEKHADQAIVATASAERSSQVADRDLEDAAGVVAEPARQRDIEHEVFTRRGDRGEVEHVFDLGNGAFTRLVTCHGAAHLRERTRLRHDRQQACR